MNDTTQQQIATIVAYGLVLAEFGLARDEIVDTVRTLEADGATPNEISEFLDRLVAEKKAAAHQVQPPAG